MLDIREFIHSFINTKNPEDLDVLNQKSNHPIILWGKNLQGKYLISNNPHTAAHHLDHERDLLGLTDLDLWDQGGKKMMANDEIVLKQERTLFFFENVHHRNGLVDQYLCMKKPLLSRSKKVLGTVGIAMQTTSPLLSILDQDLILQPYTHTPPLKKNKAPLTKTQLICLSHFIKGLSAKEIGLEMGLSYRTIEHHIEAIKSRLHCYRRSELFLKAKELLAIE